MNVVPTLKLAYSIEEAVAMTGLCRDLIYRGINENRLTAKKFGRRTLLPAQALQNFINSLPEGATSPSPNPRAGRGRKPKAGRI